MSNLILTRRPGEAIRIGDDIIVRVLRKPAGGRVKLAIDAPEGVKILREEVVDRDTKTEN